LKDFLGQNFILRSKTAEILYHDYASKMPIFDFHNHLSPEEIYRNENYKTITELWLKGDHYKWRAMRAAGVDERYITGDASDYDKFFKWAQTVERLPGSPLYHWAHLELKIYFGIDKPLSLKTAEEIYDQCNTLLSKPEFTPVGFLEKSNVKALCTTDDPFDSLEWHQKLSEIDLPFRVLPTLRPDKILHIGNKHWAGWVEKLAESCKCNIDSYESLKGALTESARRFKAVGCVVSDIGFEKFMYTRSDSADDNAASSIFSRALEGQPLSETEVEIFESDLLLFLGELYCDMGFCMQLHIGAARNVNTNLFNKLGADVGGDNIGLPTDTVKLGWYLDDLELRGKLPKTILYCLNPSDLPAMTSLAVSFCNGDCPGKVQTGSAWWFNDTEFGMRSQLRESAIAGLLSPFVGMVTDSRSLSSFARHEYFRRILCDMLGEMVENGEYPYDIETLGSLVQDVCYNNAVSYFVGN
jgi:glucuronate isomerase